MRKQHNFSGSCMDQTKNTFFMFRTVWSNLKAAGRLLGSDGFLWRLGGNVSPGLSRRCYQTQTDGWAETSEGCRWSKTENDRLTCWDGGSPRFTMGGILRRVRVPDSLLERQNVRAECKCVMAADCFRVMSSPSRPGLLFGGVLVGGLDPSGLSELLLWTRTHFPAVENPPSSPQTEAGSLGLLLSFGLLWKLRGLPKKSADTSHFYIP